MIPTETKTLRDEFAMAALTGLIQIQNPEDVITEVIAMNAYEIADAMLRVRNK